MGKPFDFGEQLKELRKGKKMTLSDVGKHIGKTSSSISCYESNRKQPPIDVLIDLANLYNVSLDYLVGFDRKESIQIAHLTDSQRIIFHLLAEEFASDSVRNNDGLNQCQQKILALLMKEFSKINHTK